MHLHENTIFDLWVRVTENVAQYPLHHVTLNQIQSLKMLRLTAYVELHVQDNTLFEL